MIALRGQLMPTRRTLQHREPDCHSSVLVYTNGAAGDTSVRRYVPALPLSRDQSRTDALQRAVASYRLAFGQPRQDDLLAYLAETIDPETLERLAGELRIDLGPP